MSDPELYPVVSYGQQIADVLASRSPHLTSLPCTANALARR